MGAPPDSTDSSGYRFAELPRETRPQAVQYTPEYDPEWVYPTGAKAGGTRDDVPVQGLELGIVAREETLAPTAEAVLAGLASYHEWAGAYPRHRIIADESAFQAQRPDDAGLVATVQPRPTDHDGLADQFRALKQTPETELLVAPNYEHTLRVALHLAGALAEQGPAVGNTDIEPATGEFRQVADTPVFERYAPLGAGSLYDPGTGAIEFDDPDAETAAELSFSPAYLDIECRSVLETAARYVTTADERLGIVARGTDGR